MEDDDLEFHRDAGADRTQRKLARDVYIMVYRSSSGIRLETPFQASAPRLAISFIPT